MKKDYIKPIMQVVLLQQQRIICSSPDGFTKSVADNPEGVGWEDDGFGSDVDDY